MVNKCDYGQQDCATLHNGICICGLPFTVETLKLQLKVHKRAIELIKKWVQTGTLEDRVYRVMRVIEALEGVPINGREDKSKDQVQDDQAGSTCCVVTERVSPEIG
jgi:hypothetical protein